MPAAVVIDEVCYYLIYIARFTHSMHDAKFQRHSWTQYKSRIFVPCNISHPFPRHLHLLQSTQNSAISLRSTSAHGQSCCKVAPVTPPKPNTFMATQRNSKAPLQLPSAMVFNLMMLCCAYLWHTVYTSCYQLPSCLLWVLFVIPFLATELHNNSDVHGWVGVGKEHFLPLCHYLSYLTCQLQYTYFVSVSFVTTASPLVLYCIAPSCL